MSDFTLCHESGLALAKRVRAREISVRELAAIFLAAIERFNPAINAVVTIDPELTLRHAAAVDKRIRAGDVYELPLLGVPFLAKDLDVTDGMRTTFGSKITANYVPNWDMFHIARLKAAGCVLLGKTNTPEDGAIPNTFNDLFGATRNPWNPEKCVGGSSGGSAAAVAACLAPLATGSDGGGSIRIPASINGVFGIKPTFGLIPFGPRGIGVMNTIGHLGPITRTVADAAAMLDIMAGDDERDRTSVPPGESYLESLDHNFAVGRVAYSADMGYAEVDSEVRELFFAALAKLQDDEWPLEEAHPSFGDPTDASEALIAFEWGTVPMQLEKKNPAAFALHTPPIKALVEQRKSLTLDELWRAYETRKRLCMAMGQFFGEYDLLITPTLTRTAFEPDRPWPMRRDDPSREDRGLNSMLHPFNLTGDPACSIPIGLTSEGLPVGMQIIAPRHHDARVLQAAKIFEGLSGSDARRPPYCVRAS